MQWGNVAEWAAAIGTVGSLFFALALLLRDRRYRERAQADGLIAFPFTLPGFSDDLENPRKRRGYAIYIFNSSNQPIFNIQLVRVSSVVLRPWAEEYSVRPRAEGRCVRFTVDSFPLTSDSRIEQDEVSQKSASRGNLIETSKLNVLAPGERLALLVGLEEWFRPDDNMNMLCFVQFMDARSKKWTRNIRTQEYRRLYAWDFSLS